MMLLVKITIICELLILLSQYEIGEGTTKLIHSLSGVCG